MESAAQKLVDALVSTLERLTSQLPDQAPSAADYVPPQE